jgi:hypothetical protein|tara:strand:+ start:147 stop:359 length:213 start_codon:yes stop_codon:yes gene_type:complete
MVTINYKKRIIMYPLIIGFFYLFRAIDFSPFETNFDFTSWGNIKLLKWLGISFLAIIFEEIRIRKKQKKD